MPYAIVKRTAQRMDGTYEIIDQLPDVFSEWFVARNHAGDLEAADRGTLHNGRAIQYDVVELEDL